ncbi:MAG: hypothetical protein ACJ0OB_04340 [Flavobacteriaceae bacterium]
MTKNPFVGLRPYKISEKNIFYGRESEVESMLSTLQKNKFVLLTGPSGSGKSSLINAGLIPRLKNGFTGQAGTEWSICNFRPGFSPINNLSYSLSCGELVSDGKPKTSDFKYYKDAILEFQNLSVAKIYNESEISKKKNLLVIIDQIEDLFVFQNNFDKELKEDELIFNLISRTVRLSDSPIYFLVSLKTEYIKNLVGYPNFQQILSGSEYSIQNIGKDGIRAIIENTFFKKNISFDHLYIEKINQEVNKDQSLLPHLQFLFQNIYNSFNDGDLIDDNNTKKIGDIKSVINNQITDFFNNLDDNKKVFFERFYKSLFNLQNTIENSDFRKAEEILNATDEDIISLTNFLNQLKTKFQNKFVVLPQLITGIKSRKNLIDNNDIIIVNYKGIDENLWEIEKKWKDEEINSYENYITFNNYSKNYEIGKTGLLKSPQLDLAVKWLENPIHNKKWSNNYNLNYEKTVEYIRKSDFRRNKEIEDRENRMKLDKKRRKIFINVVSVFAFLALLFGLYAFYEQGEAVKARKDALDQYVKANEAKKVADDAKDIAETLRDKAEESAQVAQKEKENALKSANEAKKQAKIASDAVIVAKNAEGRALELANEAQILRDDAIRAANMANNLRKSSLIETEFFPLVLRLEKLGLEDDPEIKKKKFTIIDSALKKASKYEKINFELNQKSKETESLYILLQTSLQVLENKNSYSETSMLLGKTKDQSAIRSISTFRNKLIVYGGDNGILVFIDVDSNEINEINLNKERIRTTTIVSENEVLVGTFEGNLYSVNLNSKEFSSEFSIDSPINQVYIDNDSNKIIVLNKKIILLDIENNIVEEFEIEISSFNQNITKDILYVSSGNMLFYLENNTLTEINLLDAMGLNESKSTLSNTNISSILLIDNMLLLGTENGQIYFYEKIDKNDYMIKEKIDVHFTEITRLFYDDFNKILYSSSYDNQLLKYNLFENDSLDIINANNNHLSLEGHQKWVWDINQYTDNQNRKRLITSDENGNLISWFLNQKDLVNKVQDLLDSESSKL